MDSLEHFDPNARFDFDMFQSLLDQLLEDLSELKYTFVFTRVCREITKVFQELGGVLKKAFEDIHDKCNIIKRNYDLHKKIYTGIIPFILIEKAMDIAQLNGENGGFLKGTDMDNYKQYESTARTILRLMWFLDFVYYMLNGLSSDRKKSLGNVCSDAYGQALAPNHPAALAVAVKAGMYLVPNREKLFEIFFEDSKYPKAYDEISEAANKIDIIRQRLWNFYKEENLTNLP